MSCDRLRIAVICANEFGPHRRARPASMVLPRGPRIKRRHRLVIVVGWNRELVEERMFTAGAMLKKCGLPKELLTLARMVSAYPAVVHYHQDAALWQPQDMAPVRPTGAELTDLDIFFDWLLAIRPEERPVVFAHAWGASFRLIRRLDPKHRSHSTQRKRWRDGIDQVVAWLRAKDRQSRKEGSPTFTD